MSDGLRQAHDDHHRAGLRGSCARSPLPPGRPLALQALRTALAWRTALFCLVLTGASLAATSAQAYPWMIRHKYSACGMCHLDPSGGGLLTEYGREEGDLVLRTEYVAPSDEGSQEPSSTAGFLWGAFDLPEGLLLGGSFRGMVLAVKPQGTPTDVRLVAMQADLRAGLKLDVFRAGGSLGYAHTGALAASLTHRDKHNLVSREHWLGVALDDNSIWLRAGRMNLPFGVRNIEHTLWVRNATRTDINDNQQYGVAFAYVPGDVRLEVMGIVGNYQLNPDAFRERGYSGFVEWSPASGYAVGVSSMLTSTLLDTRTRTTLIRQAHGAFARASPWDPLVLMLEANALINSPAAASTTPGFVGVLQADYEPVQGLHAMATGELLQDPEPGATPSAGGWLGLAWFFLPHADARVDGGLQSVATPTQARRVLSLIGQLHFYL
jgi:hypothetical protein